MLQNLCVLSTHRENADPRSTYPNNIPFNGIRQQYIFADPKKVRIALFCWLAVKVL